MVPPLEWVDVCSSPQEIALNSWPYCITEYFWIDFLSLSFSLKIGTSKYRLKFILLKGHIFFFWAIHQNMQLVSSGVFYFSFLFCCITWQKPPHTDFLSRASNSLCQPDRHLHITEFHMEPLEMQTLEVSWAPWSKIFWDRELVPEAELVLCKCIQRCTLCFMGRGSLNVATFWKYLVNLKQVLRGLFPSLEAGFSKRQK